MTNTTKIAEKILSLAEKHGAEFCEVLVTQNETSLKRIRQGQVDQPPAGEQWGIDLAVTKNQRRKAVSFDNPMFAEDIIADTLKYIDLLPLQPLYLPTEPFIPVAQFPNSYDKKTAELNDTYLIDIAHELNKELDRHKLFFSGKIAQGKGEITYANSLGTKQNAVFTLATVAAFAFDYKNSSISAFASSGGISIDHIDTKQIIKELISKCELMRKKEKIDLFADKQEGEDIKIDVIVEPYFFEAIFEWLGFFGFNGLFVQRGESFISNRLGQTVTGDNISIKDDPFDDRNRGMGLPFDFEGRPRNSLMLIENGIAKNAVYDTALAAKWKQEPTGNALPPSQRAEGAAPFNLVVEGGESSIEEMIAQCEKPALWITKLHYLGMKHYQTATMTGIAQHGVFLIENGEIKGPVENLRFEESIPEALKRVEALSPSRLIYQPRSLSAPSGIVAPAMKIRDFRFVGSTQRSV